MQEHNSIQFANWQEKPAKAAVSALASLRVGFERIKGSKQARVVCWCVIAVLSLTLWTLVTFRVAQKQQEQRFEAWQTRFVNDYLSMQEAAERGYPPDPKEVLREQEITMIAQALYGIEGNSDEDLHKCCWVFFNRVDSTSGEFADVKSLEEVFSKPHQFVGYEPGRDYPVLDRLRQIASEEYDIWKNGKSRPFDVKYCWYYWSPDKIMLLKEVGDLIHGV